MPTGSFTGLAILSPGVNAELSSGTGVNSGLGNLPIWANGQRDTSNTFLLNGVDASNLFNGKSTSEVSSARIVNNTGIGGAASIPAPLPSRCKAPRLPISPSARLSPRPLLKPSKNFASTLPCTTPSKVPPAALTSI